jgi:membrane peptidoglycan carboxypeptidase
VLQNSEVSTGRKINEVVVAGELTRRYTKDEILELYLNEVLFFGNQTYGVEAAAQFYFGKSAADLTLPEAALLASIPSDPVNNEPVTNRQRALDLMRVTMQRMADVGCLEFQHEPYNGADFCVTDDTISSDETILQIALVESKTFRSRQFGVRYPHFTQLVQAQLENIFGANEIYSRGYVVTTTLDSRLQNQAQNAVTQRVDALSTNGINTGAALVVDPRNGAILALVGSPDFDDAEIDGQVDNTRTFQQPGSSIKPIEYTAALTGYDRNGNGALDTGEYFTPATILWDVPTTYQGTPPYIPRNFDGQFRGPVSVRNALQNSLNVPAVKTYEFIGNDVFRATAEAMGLRFVENAEFNLTTGVGSTDVRLIDMVRAFGVLANNGRRVELYTIQNIVDSDGNPVGIPPREEPQQVVSPDIAYLMQNILSDDQARAPQFGLNSNLTIQGLPTQNVVAVKTGTTDQSRDLWTLGFTNNRVVGVWLGTVENTPTFNTTGFTAAAPVWNTIMRAALENNPPTGFSAPGNGTVVNRQICRDTGTLPASNCANIANEIFAANRPPPPAESGLVAVLQVDSWTGLIANEFCPDNVIEATFANITDPSAVNWINSTGAGQAYAQRVGIQLPISPAPQLACNQNTPIPVARITAPQGGQTVQGNVAIIGQVSAEGFNRYQLEVASLATPESFQIVDNFSTTQQPNAGSTLANWNTLTVPNGGYILRLAAFSENGGYVYRTTQIAVNNPAATATPIIPTQPPIPIVPTEPLPFDPLVTPLNSQGVPVGPTPTIDPLG